MDLLLVCAAGLFAGTVSGIVGTGSSIILVPLLVIAFGPQQAVPIMAIAAIMANVSRIAAWPREVDWRAAAAYAATSAPAAALAVYVSKSVVFRSFGALPWLVILEGLIVGASLTVGTFIAKPFVRRLDPQHFRWMMDGIMLVSGIALLWMAFH